MIVQNKHALVVGLARSGLAVARALARRGATVTVTDRKPPADFADVLRPLMKDKIGLELGSQREETFLRHDMIVISPGVPWDLPQLQAARGRGIPVYPEVEAASWFLEGTLVGITGSNGKTTTTSLLGDMLKASGFPTFVGGNIGNALSSAVDSARPGTRFVTELSSFQLEGIHEFRPHVAVMLNLSPNHLDRHPTLEAYAQAKQRIFRNQRGKDYAVLNADDPWVAGLQSIVPSKQVFFSRQRELPSGVFAAGGKVYYRTRHLERVMFETRDVSLRGDFNLEDVLAATAAACLLGADFAAIRRAVRSFKAVEHRLEFVRELQGVEFYNNSKATSVDATLKSLEAFQHGVHLILGGKDKGAPYTPLIPLMKDRVREVLVIGAAAPIITQQLTGSTELVQAGDLATAVREAYAHARPGDTVLLAPACSSFDQFKDYEERGRMFKELVNGLRETRPAPGVSGIATSESGTASQRQKPYVKKPEPEPLPVKTSGAEGVSHATDSAPTAAAPESAEKSELAATVVVEAPKAADPAAPALPEAALEASAPQPSRGGLDAAPGSLEGRTAEHAIAGRASRLPGPELPATSSEAHMELTYVYEVDAVEMPAGESPVGAEDEPVITISDQHEILDDDVMPFEARPRGTADVRRPKSEAPITPAEAMGSKPEAAPASQQPKLFENSS